MKKACGKLNGWYLYIICSINKLIESLQQSYEVDAIVITILQYRKVRPRRIK